MERASLAAARKLVSDWLDTHSSATLEQMARDLDGNSPPPERPPDPTAAAGALW
jgi:hypothetical protein